MASDITWRAWGVRPGRHYHLIVRAEETDINNLLAERGEQTEGDKT